MTRRTVNAPFTTADLRDLERVAAAIQRIQDRHPNEYDDYEFDPINQVRAAVFEAIQSVEDHYS